MSNILPIYHNLLAISEDPGDERVRAVLENGIGFSDCYDLFVRDTGNRLSTEMSPMYPPSLEMAGLVLDKLVDGVEDSDTVHPGAPTSLARSAFLVCRM